MRNYITRHNPFSLYKKRTRILAPFSNRGFSSFVVDRRCSASRLALTRARPMGGCGLDPCAPPVCCASMRSAPSAGRGTGQVGTSCQTAPAAIMALRRTMSFLMQAVRATLGGLPRATRR
jgi:hypothetical protein